MKAMVVLVWSLCGFAVFPVYAETVFSLADVIAAPGDTFEVNLSIDNSVALRAFQFVVNPSPPENVTFLGVSGLGRASGWTTAYNEKEDGAIVLVLVYSISRLVIEPGSGDVLAFNYTLGKNVSGEPVSLEISEIAVSYPEGAVIPELKAKNGSITVQGTSSGSSYKRGDVNRDGATDIFDLLELLGILSGI